MTLSFRSFYWAIRDNIVNKKYGFPRSVHIGRNVYIHGNVEIGEDSYVQSYSNLVTGNNSVIRIGKNCKIAHNVTLRACSHNRENPDRRVEDDIVVGDNVWIGANAVLIEGIVVGNNAIIGANAVVSKDVGPNTIVGGVPARLLGEKKTPFQIHPQPRENNGEWQVRQSTKKVPADGVGAY